MLFRSVSVLSCTTVAVTVEVESEVEVESTGMLIVSLTVEVCVTAGSVYVMVPLTA